MEDKRERERREQRQSSKRDKSDEGRSYPISMHELLDVPEHNNNK